MKAIVMKDYGGAEVLNFEDVSRPVPNADEVLVKVHASSVNPVDWMIRNGYGRDWEMPLPAILGCEIAGTVAEVGASVRKFKVGDEIYGYINLRRGGGYAEFVAAKESDIALKPKNLDFVNAAAVPVGSLTSWQAIFDKARLAAGQKILIHAASGGVGSMAVQLAKAKGAFVIGTASAKNEEFVRSLGADQFIDYTKTRFEEVATEVDVVFDTIGGETQERSFHSLKKGGFLVSIVNPPAPEKAVEFNVQAEFVGVVPNAAQLDEITELIEAGKIKTHVETILPLTEARKAHELSATGKTRGKIVLTV